MNQNIIRLGALCLAASLIGCPEKTYRDLERVSTSDLVWVQWKAQ